MIRLVKSSETYEYMIVPFLSLFVTFFFFQKNFGFKEKLKDTTGNSCIPFTQCIQQTSVEE